jgi:hypothetical protein
MNKATCLENHIVNLKMIVKEFEGHLVKVTMQSEGLVYVEGYIVKLDGFDCLCVMCPEEGKVSMIAYEIVESIDLIFEGSVLRN